MITTEYRIEFCTGTPGSWATAKKTTEKYWKRDLGYLRKACPQDHYRVVKEVTLTETLTETIG